MTVCTAKIKYYSQDQYYKNKLPRKKTTLTNLEWPYYLLFDFSGTFSLLSLSLI